MLGNSDAVLEQLVYVGHCEIRRDLKPGERVRWESDNQGGGRWLRFFAGVTLCLVCDDPIDVDGECSFSRVWDGYGGPDGMGAIVSVPCGGAG